MAINQDQAVQLEWGRLVNRLNELESVIGIRQTGFTNTDRDHRDFQWIRNRIRRLARQAGLKINPDDPETQLDPIILGEWMDAQADNNHPLWG